MAKRKNSNPRTKKVDPSDDQTIIKISSPRRQSKAKASTKTAPDNKAEKKTSTRNNAKAQTSSTKRATKSTTRKKSTTSSSRKKTTESNKVSTTKTNTETATPKTSATPTSSTSTPVTQSSPESVKISQSVAILIDGNNIEMSLTRLTNNKSAVLNFDTVIPKLLNGRGLNRLIYFREGRSISQKLADRLHTHYFGSVVPCHKSADIPLSIQATQLAEKVDTIIILSGDSDYVELVRHVKSKGVRVEIAAIEITTAAILKEEADYYSPITKEDAFIMK